MSEIDQLHFKKSIFFSTSLSCNRNHICFSGFYCAHFDTLIKAIGQILCDWAHFVHPYLYPYPASLLHALIIPPFHYSRTCSRSRQTIVLWENRGYCLIESGILSKAFKVPRIYPRYSRERLDSPGVMGENLEASGAKKKSTFLKKLN